MKRLKSYFFTNTNLNSRGKYISLKDNAEPNETLFSDLLDSVVKPKVGSDYQDQADYNAVNTKDSTKFITAENLPEVDTTGSLLTITTTAAVDTNLLRRKKYTVAVNTPVNTSDISSRVDSKLVTPANLPKFALDNSLYSQQDGQVSYYDSPITETTDAGLFTIYKLKLKALTSEMITHSGVRLNTVLNTLRVDVNACVSDAELASAVSTLNTAIGLKANKVTPTFVTGYNGTKVVVNSQGVVTSVSKASALDITNDSSVSGSTVKDALNWLKANGGGTGGASDTDGVTNLSDVSGATATDAFNTLLEATQQYFVKDVIGKTNGDTLEVDKINVLNLTSSTTFTLPTASITHKGKVLIVVQSNAGNYKAVLAGAAQGPLTISDFRDVIVFNCVYNGTGYDWFAISKDDSKMCSNEVVISASIYTASANDNIKADAQSLGSDINITIPTAGVAGRMIYAYYPNPTGSPSAYVVNIIGGYSATLNQLDWFLLRDNGSYWEAIGTSLNTVELLANKATSILGNETDTTKYTNTKAVADYITFFYTNGVIPAIEGHFVDLAVVPSSTIYAPTTLSTTTALALKANANSPTFTGTPSGPTATSGTNTTQLATTAFVTSAISDIPTPSTPTLDTVTDAGNTTTNSIEVGGLVVDYPSGLGVAVEITKGGAGEALTVNKTSGSGNVASFNNGTTLVKDLEVSTATANRPTFFDSSKKLVIATGALLGTWFQTLTAKSTPIGADTIIVNDSASSFEAKKTTLAQLITYIISKILPSLTADYLPKWNGTSLVNSDLSGSGGNLTLFGTGNTNRMVFATSNSPTHGGITLQTAGGTDIWSLRTNPVAGRTALSASGYMSISSYAGSATITMDNDLSSGRYIYLSSKYDIYSSTDTGKTTRVSSQYGTIIGPNLVSSGNLGGWYTNNSLNNGNALSVVGGGHFTTGIVIGGNTINASAQLDLQATNKGLGLNQIAGDLGAGRNGLVWYDTTNHLFKGVQNGGVVSFATQTNTQVYNVVMFAPLYLQKVGFVASGNITTILNNNSDFATVEYSTNNGTSYITLTFTANVWTGSISVTANANILFRVTFTSGITQGTLTINQNI